MAEGMNIRTSVFTSHGKLSEEVYPFNGNTDLVGETGPPDRDEDPYFIKNWNVPILSDPGWSIDDRRNDH